MFFHLKKVRKSSVSVHFSPTQKRSTFTMIRRKNLPGWIQNNMERKICSNDANTKHLVLLQIMQSLNEREGSQ